jgi:hypothetical protein
MEHGQDQFYAERRNKKAERRPAGLRVRAVKRLDFPPPQSTPFQVELRSISAQPVSQITHSPPFALQGCPLGFCIGNRGVIQMSHSLRKTRTKLIVSRSRNVLDTFEHLV